MITGSVGITVRGEEFIFAPLVAFNLHALNKLIRSTFLSSSLGILNAGLGRLASASNGFLENGYNTGGSYNPASVQLSGSAEYIALASIGTDQ